MNISIKNEYKISCGKTKPHPGHKNKFANFSFPLKIITKLNANHLKFRKFYDFAIGKRKNSIKTTKQVKTQNNPIISYIHRYRTSNCNYFRKHCITNRIRCEKRQEKSEKILHS